MFFKRKPKIEEPKKPLYEINRNSNMAVIKCPYCLVVLEEVHVKKLYDVKITQCTNCNKEIKM